MNVTTAITGVFTSVLEFVADSLQTVSGIFWDAETGLTFIGSACLVGLGIAVITMLVAMVRSLIKGRG